MQSFTLELIKLFGSLDHRIQLIFTQIVRNLAGGPVDFQCIIDLFDSDIGGCGKLVELVATKGSLTFVPSLLVVEDSGGIYRVALGVGDKFGCAVFRLREPAFLVESR